MKDKLKKEAKKTTSPTGRVIISLSEPIYQFTESELLEYEKEVIEEALPSKREAKTIADKIDKRLMKYGYDGLSFGDFWEGFNFVINHIKNK